MFRCVLCTPVVGKPVVGVDGIEEEKVDTVRCRVSVEYATSYLMTTRFNTETWNQHRQFMDTGAAGKGIRACYCSPIGIASNIIEICKKVSGSDPSKGTGSGSSTETESGSGTSNASIKLFVLEMHNDRNTIMGVGAVFSKSHYRRYSMYTDDKYNVCAFVGPCRIDRTEMTPEEESVMVMLDALCFRGKQHMKRLRGVTLFPLALMEHVREIHGIDLRSTIQTMFRHRFQAKPGTESEAKPEAESDRVA